jgi:hypothetical protein
MAATTSDRNTQSRNGHRRNFPVAAATIIPAGVLAAIDTSGNLVNAATSTTLKTVGVTEGYLNNGTGVAGQIKADVLLGIYGPFGNSTSTDQITAADIGNDCYVVDNQTVAKTNGANTRVVAAKVFDVDASGVWLKFS